MQKALSIKSSAFLVPLEYLYIYRKSPNSNISIWSKNLIYIKPTSIYNKSESDH